MRLRDPPVSIVFEPYTSREKLMDDTLAVTTGTEFQSTLGRLVKTAYENGVAVDGGWEVDGDDGHPDWDVVVTVVERGD
jgi:hypothetical protein